MLQTIRLEVEVGWQLRCREVGGMDKTQMNYQNSDSLGKKNSRSSVFLPYDWSNRNQSKITTESQFIFKVKTLVQGIIMTNRSYAK